MIKLVNQFITNEDKKYIDKYLDCMIKGFEVNPITELEDAFSNYIGVNHCKAVNSGSSALHIALAALELKENDEVICTTHTCVAILNAIKYVGAIPKLVDIKYNVEHMDYNIDESKILNNINNKTKAIVVPHMFGIPAAIEEIRKFNLTIIEDGTLSLGAKLNNGNMVGSFGDIGIFSLHKSKMVSADVGGIIVTNNEQYFSKINKLLDYGGCEKYNVTYNYTMGDINSVIAKQQLKNIDNFIKIRRENAKKISDLLGNCSCIKIPFISNNHVYFRYLVELPENISAEYFVKKGVEYGIEFGRGVFPALHNYLGLSKSKFDNSEKAQRRIVSVPVYPGLTDHDLKSICNAFLNIVEGVIK